MLQFLLNGICAGLGLALLALGFALIYHSTRVFHVAHAAVFTASGYAAYWVLASLHCRLPIAAVVALAAGSSIGLTLEWLVYRPLAVRGASALVVLIASFGAYVTA